MTVDSPETSAETNALHTFLPPHPDRLVGLRERVVRHLQDERVAESDIIVLCVEEACTNAIVHSRTTKDIKVLLQLRGERLLVTVRDEGRGVVIEELEPITMPDPLSCGSRGLPLIAGLMDELKLVCNPGLEVTMPKQVRRVQGASTP